MVSLFGQVWLWSLLSFVLGALLLWLVLARPARRHADELAAELARVRAAAQSQQRVAESPVARAAAEPASAAGEDAYEDWRSEVPAARPYTLMDDVLEPEPQRARWDDEPRAYPSADRRPEPPTQFVEADGQLDHRFAGSDLAADDHFVTQGGAESTSLMHRLAPAPDDSAEHAVDERPEHHDQDDYEDYESSESRHGLLDDAAGLPMPAADETTVFPHGVFDDRHDRHDGHAGHDQYDDRYEDGYDQELPAEQPHGHGDPGGPAATPGAYAPEPTAPAELDVTDTELADLGSSHRYPYQPRQDAELAAPPAPPLHEGDWLDGDDPADDVFAEDMSEEHHAAAAASTGPVSAEIVRAAERAIAERDAAHEDAAYEDAAYEDEDAHAGAESRHGLLPADEDEHGYAPAEAGAGAARADYRDGFLSHADVDEAEHADDLFAGPAEPDLFAEHGAEHTQLLSVAEIADEQAVAGAAAENLTEPQEVDEPVRGADEANVHANQVPAVPPLPKRQPKAVQAPGSSSTFDAFGGGSSAASIRSGYSAPQAPVPASAPVAPPVSQPAPVAAVDRPRSLFEPVIDPDQDRDGVSYPPLPTSGVPRPAEAPAPPPRPQRQYDDTPFVPKFVPDGTPLLGGLPQRPTGGSGSPATAEPFAPSPEYARTAPAPAEASSEPEVDFFGVPVRSNGVTRPRRTEAFNPRAPYGPGSVLPKPDGTPPSSEFLVKATLAGRRYYTAQSTRFGTVKPDVWFASVTAAEHAGFRPPKQP
ncbi:hypothetical protein F0L68_06810 [Solihabitans fulvus]|uniref:Uncharacterized protein n=1 Tax=Solihabitans fulvus TaxID=1892852 RepID=A0A5B2XLP7_9PSEU|nr:hypothetical protein [Solihabitans fulvus]KAA2264788.1 hypothetical protein F0L68_06810 [Solihabitans fulvus]